MERCTFNTCTSFVNNHVLTVRGSEVFRSCSFPFPVAPFSERNLLPPCSRVFCRSKRKCVPKLHQGKEIVYVHVFSTHINNTEYQ